MTVGNAIRRSDTGTIADSRWSGGMGCAPVSAKRPRCGSSWGSTIPLREVGALLDAKAVHGGRSAYNHLLCLAQTNDIPRKRVDEVLSLVGLSEVARKRSRGFSLGMSQRLGISATLLGDPGDLDVR
jgi:hypothetical protein